MGSTNMSSYSLTYKNVINKSFVNDELKQLVEDLEKDFVGTYAKYDTPKNGIFDKIIRYVMSVDSSDLYIPETMGASYNIDRKNFPEIKLVLFTRLVSLWNSVTRQGGIWKSDEDSKKGIQNWIGENKFVDDSDLMTTKDYDTLLTWDSMSKYITYSIEILDLVERGEENTFVVDTTFLDQYEYRKGLEKVGCKAHMWLKPDGFKIFKLEYKGRTFTKGDQECPEMETAFHAFYCSVMTFMTVCTHLIQCHYLSSYKMALANHKFSMDSTLRKILLPVEFNVVRTIARGNVSILASGSSFTQSTSFTNDGIKNILNDYASKHSSLKREFSMVDGSFLGLSEDEWKCEPFASNLKWITHFREYMKEICDYIDPVDKELWVNTFVPNHDYKDTDDAFYWSMVLVHYNEIRHRMMVNISFIRTISRYSTIIRTGYETRKCSHTIEESFGVLSLTLSTTHDLYPINYIPNITFEDIGLQDVMVEFRKTMSEIKTCGVTFLNTDELFSSVGI